MSSLPLIIINPASARGATRDHWPGLASDLRTHFGPFDCLWTSRAGDGRDIAAREAQAGRDLIVACGGDGTISEVANGILESGHSAELGILPSGTGGDFRRTLHIPTRFRDAAAALSNGETRSIDAGRVSYRDTEGELKTRYFINIASFGMGGAVIERVKNKKHSWLPIGGGHLSGGRISFATAALQTAISYTKPLVRVQLDDKKEVSLRVINFCVANARFFGGGMNIAPQAKINDGLFDVVAIGDLSVPALLSNAHRVYLGAHLGTEHVHSTRARRITASTIDQGAQITLEADGEIIGQLPATFEIVPLALRLRVPRIPR